MTDYTEKEWATFKVHAQELGQEHGERAGESFPIDDVPAATHVLDGIDAYDDEVTDTFPRDPLSGEWAGEHGIGDLLAELGVEDDSDDGELARAFEDQFTACAQQVITKRASDMVQAHGDGRSLVMDTNEQRRALCAETGTTLNGQPARISGATSDFATVYQVRSGLSAEWSWSAAARIVASGGRFQS